MIWNMVLENETQILPKTLIEFLNWEPNDCFNGVARAIWVECRWANKIWGYEQKTGLYLWCFSETF
jgi:hypothetical protein